MKLAQDKGDHDSWHHAEGQCKQSKVVIKTLKRLLK